MFSALFFKTCSVTYLTIFGMVIQFKDTFFCCFLQMWNIHSAIFICSWMNYSETLYNNEASDSFMFLLQVLFKWILIIYHFQLEFSEESPLSRWWKKLSSFSKNEPVRHKVAHKYVLDILLLDPHWPASDIHVTSCSLGVWTLYCLKLNSSEPFVSCEPEPFCFRGCRRKRGWCQTAASSRHCLGSWTKLAVCGRLL